MTEIQKNLLKISEALEANIKLVAVSKYKTAEAILEAYDIGHRVFGENYVQELCSKKDELPADIEWHFIGHLQSNKAKYIVPFVSLIHGVDSFSLLQEINKQALKNGRLVSCLLQVHIAQESSKEGFDKNDLLLILPKIGDFAGIRIEGLMGMASFTENQGQLKNEFLTLKAMFDDLQKHETDNFKMQTLSMGMSSDYPLGIECGSNMIRVGTSIFGSR